MALPPGTRLGPYELQSPLGAGGMGEVYRGTDTKLKRDVAIKVLPTALASDPERLARFQREAEVLAALNRPNIAAIYGLEDSTDIKALVMLAGVRAFDGATVSDTLAAVLKSNPDWTRLPGDTAAPIRKLLRRSLEKDRRRRLADASDA